MLAACVPFSFCALDFGIKISSEQMLPKRPPYDLNYKFLIRLKLIVRGNMTAVKPSEFWNVQVYGWASFGNSQILKPVSGCLVFDYFGHNKCFQTIFL
jgi:hypothetical protein